MDLRTKRTICFLVGIVSILAIVGTISYAYFTAGIEEGDIYSLKGTAKYDPEYKISFTESNEGISLNNTYPMPDSMGLQLDPYTFTVKNEDSKKLNVSVVLEVLGTSTLADNLVNIGIDDEVKTLNPDIVTTASESRFRSAYEIYSLSLEPNESKTVDLRVWINSDGTVENAQNKIWSSRVLVVPDMPALDKTLAHLNITSQGVRSLFDDPALTDEGIYEMEDDYGTSYYYRGAVENNYVKFAEYYWRIIRINGNGTMRIIYDGTVAHANGKPSNDRYTNVSKSFNVQYKDTKYEGWMYGPIDTVVGTITPSENKTQAQTNTADSDIKTIVDAWYKTNIEDKSYSQYVSDTLFCNDRSIPGRTITKWSSDTGLGYAKNATAYGALGRFLTGNNSTTFSARNNIKPQFTCPQKNDAFTVSDIEKGNGALEYPVGLITADEIVAAGSGKYGTANNQYYLYKSRSYYTWSLSPSGLTASGYAYVFNISDDGSLYNSNAHNTSGAIAPVINLTAEYVESMVGDGTMESPYRVE